MILINGEHQQSLPATDRGLHYGDGLFETIAIRHGRPLLWRQHMQRLQKGCERLGIPMPDEALLQREAEQACEDTDRAVLKIILTRGSGGRGYQAPQQVNPSRVILRYPWPSHADSTAPISVRLCKTPLGCNPVLAGIKHLNRLEQILARNEWQDETIAEGLMCNAQGELIEGVMSNLFCVRGGKLLTPDLSHCGVEGVMRALVLELAARLDIPCEITSIVPEEMDSMDEVFITNSIIAIKPVRQVDGVQYDENPVTTRLQDALHDYLEEL